MSIIRDEETGGICMIPLLIEWGVHRCNIKDCKEQPTTIITQLTPDVPVSGWCEKHYQEFKTNRKFKGTLIFDDYDAFAK